MFGRAAAIGRKERVGRVDVDRGLAAHLCRCTGWQTVYEAIDTAASGSRPVPRQDLDAAARGAELEGGGRQRVGIDVPLGGGGFADDVAPRDALVAVPSPTGSTGGAVDAAGMRWGGADPLADRG